MASKKRKYSMEKLNRAAQYLVDELKANGMLVMRYDSKSSHSIYLKVDDGALGTIRISDHEGKPHLGYKYNLIAGSARKTVRFGNRPRHYCPLSDIIVLRDKLLYDRDMMVTRMGLSGYHSKMVLSKQKGMRITENNARKGKDSFWTDAKYV